ncbi:MAG: 2-phosphosulfolactate phosphatase [Planctomycetota bacterium]
MGVRANFDRGPTGAARAAERGDVVVVVDTLSFSSTVATAVHHGSYVFPVAPGEDGAAIAADTGGILTVPRSQVTEEGQLSLSPVPYQFLAPGTKVVCHSPNGGACCREAREAPLLLAGCILNAFAVAEAIRGADRPVTVVACGEVRRDGSRRDAEEDDLGAGAILAALDRRLTGDALAIADAFDLVREKLFHALSVCESGRELEEVGFAEDVAHAAKLDRYDSVPVLDTTGRPYFRRG